MTRRRRNPTRRRRWTGARWRLLPELFQRTACGSVGVAWRLQLFRHLDHRAAKAKPCENTLRLLVFLRGSEDHTRRAIHSQPVARRLDEGGGHTVPLRFGRDDNIVNETRRFS